MLTMIVSMKAKAGHEADLETTLRALLAEVSDEPGCGGVIWGWCSDGEGLTVIERYRDEATLAAHREAPHMATLGPAVFDHLADAPTFHVIAEL